MLRTMELILGLQPMTETVVEEFRYAKLQNNGQIFEIKDRTKDIFLAANDLRGTVSDARKTLTSAKDAVDGVKGIVRKASDGDGVIPTLLHTVRSWPAAPHHERSATSERSEPDRSPVRTT